jgi:hypothetical protein
VDKRRLETCYLRNIRCFSVMIAQLHPAILALSRNIKIYFEDYLNIIVREGVGNALIQPEFRVSCSDTAVNTPLTVH